MIRVVGRSGREAAPAARDSFPATDRIALPRGRRILAGAALLLGAAIGAACAPSATRAPSPYEADVYAVWGAMVDGLVGRGHDARIPVLLDTIAESAGRRGAREAYAAMLRSRGARFGATDEMIAAFTSPDSADVRIDRTMLARRTRIDVRPVDLSRPEMAEPQRSGMIGRVHLSRVAFDATRSRALVQGDWICGPLCGHGSTVVMEKDSTGRWREKASLTDIFY